MRIPTTTSCAPFARNRKQRAPTGRKRIDRRAITSDTDRRERLIQLVAIQLTQTEFGELGGSVGEKAALFTDKLLPPAEEVMPGQILQSRIYGLLEDEAMHYEFEEAWTEREEARKAVHGTLAGGSAFRALRKACKNLREIIQAADDRYLEVSACELEELIVAGDLRGWYGHLKGGCKLQGKKLGNAQYIRDENGKLLYGSLTRSVRGRDDISLPCSTRPRPPSIEQLSRAYRKSRQPCQSETRRL